MKRLKLFQLMPFILMTAFIIIISCTKDESGSGPPKYSVGGTVEGLAGSGLVLQNNSSDTLPISGNGAFTFPTTLEDSSVYNVTVESYPSGQTCYIENGSGIIDGASITNVRVICETPSGPGSCSGGSIVYYHELANDYAGFHQEITVSGTVPFTCNENNISGSGTLSISVNGTITATCMETTYSGTASLNVTLEGTFSASQIVFEVNETWYAGSPIASGTTTNTCDPDSQPFNYPLIETTNEHTLTFPNIDGYQSVQPYMGDAGSGNYSWTIYIE